GRAGRAAGVCPTLRGRGSTAVRARGSGWPGRRPRGSSLAVPAAEPCHGNRRGNRSVDGMEPRGQGALHTRYALSSGSPRVAVWTPQTPRDRRETPRRKGEPCRVNAVQGLNRSQSPPGRLVLRVISGQSDRGGEAFGAIVSRIED